MLHPSVIHHHHEPGKLNSNPNPTAAKLIVAYNRYQQGPLSEISDQSQLNTLDENVQGVIVPWSIDVYEPLENNPDGLALIKAATTRGSKVIVEVDPTGSNVWFAKSEKREPNFDKFYIWRPVTIKGSETNPLPPNNWVSFKAFFYIK